MSELTPREWQDIEKAKPALRIDAGWADMPDVASAFAQQDASRQAAGAATPAAPDSAADPAADEELVLDASSMAPRSPATSSTPESLGLPTAG